MKRYDKMMALLRSSKYVNDLKKLEKKKKAIREPDRVEREIKIQDIEREFCEKWGISEIYDPQFEVYYREQDEQHEKKKKKGGGYYVEEDLIEVVESIEEPPLKEIWKCSTSGMKFKRYRFKCSYDGKYLYLKVNIYRKKQELLSQFKKIIDEWKIWIPTKTRDKPTSHPLWEIYDMHHKDRLSFPQIAEILSSKDGRPTRNLNFESNDKQARRAYNKARKMIEQVEESVKNQGA